MGDKDSGLIDYNNITIQQATQLQRQMSGKISLQYTGGGIATIAGADISLNMFSSIIYAGIVVLDYSSLQPLAYSLIKSGTSFPYVPGYLAFREVPALMQALEQMPLHPDVIMADGQGIAHPRRVGIATHLGLLSGIPTLGCAKKILFGKWQEPDQLKGSYTPITDKEEVIGYALRTKNKVKPVFISPGNNMSLEKSLEIALHCTGTYRIPEPTRRAHDFVNLFRTGQLQEGYHTVDGNTLF